MLSTCFSTGSLSQASFRPLRRLGLLQIRRAACRLRAAPRRRFLAHAERHAPRRAEQVAEHRHRVARAASRTAAPGRRRAARGRRSRSSPAAGSTSTAMRFSSPGALELREEVAQVGVAHRAYRPRCATRSASRSAKSTSMRLRPRTANSRSLPGNARASVVAPIQPNAASATPAMSAAQAQRRQDAAPRRRERSACRAADARSSRCR